VTAVPDETEPLERGARIGVVVPFDFALDREYWQLVPSDVSLHVTRTPPHEGPVGIPLARAVAEPAEAADAVRTLTAIEPDVVAFACTSGSFVNGLAGERALREAMTAAGARRAVTTSGGLLDALHSLWARRVALGTPYVADLGALLADFIIEAGFEAASLANLDLEGGIADLADAEVERLAEAAFTRNADALFLSCTNLPTVGLLERLTSRYGMPVLSANQVTMWAALRAAGIAQPVGPVAVPSAR
jgi:maleate isomerase